MNDKRPPAVAAAPSVGAGSSDAPAELLDLNSDEPPAGKACQVNDPECEACQ